MNALGETKVSRKNFLLMATIGAAGIVGLGAFARRKIQKGKSLPLGISEDSIFKPRADALERMRKGLGK